MKVHYLEEVEDNVNWRVRADASWVYCGKHISDQQATLNLSDVACGSCLKAFERRKLAAVA